MPPDGSWEKYPVQYVRGVGPGRSEILSRMGINTVKDLLCHFPVRYEDRSRIVPVGEARPGETQTVRGTVQARGLKRTYRGYAVLKVAVSDGTGLLYATWFNQPYLEKNFPVGADVVLSGKIDFYDELQIVNPAFEVVLDEGEFLEAGCIVPIYPLSRGLYQKQMRRILKEALGKFSASMEDYMPSHILGKHGFMGLSEAFEKIHFPLAESDYAEAGRRLVFDEFFLLQLVLARDRLARRRRKGISHRVSGGLPGRFAELLPFPLTGSQKKVINEINADMAAPAPMNRLVQGEVGSGKTVVAVSAMLTAVENGCQAVLMAPTEILAGQHYLYLQKSLMPLGVRIGLLTGGLGRNMREEMLEGAAEGRLDIVVGTHALLEEKVKFKNPGLIVIDEQHKFGVRQREALKKKGYGKSDLLMISATPIPRTLALTVYGDVDVSTVGEVPGGRDVTTYLVSESERRFMYGFVKDEIRKGRQAYYICPLIEDPGDSGLKSAAGTTEKLRTEVFPGHRVELLHGRMTAAEKEEKMRAFSRGLIDVLVCTSVVEVGIDVSNATVMIVEDAERFGLAQLHQMRGRVGRGRHTSYCMLVGDPANEEARRRLDVLAGTSDGLRIAQEDLGLRGPGQFLGTKQHGLPDLKLGNMRSDLQVLELARDEAVGVVSADPDLKLPENRRLAKAVAGFSARGP